MQNKIQFVTTKGKSEAEIMRASIKKHNFPNQFQNAGFITIEREIPNVQPKCSRVLNGKCVTSSVAPISKPSKTEMKENIPMQWVAIEQDMKSEYIAFPVYDNANYGNCIKIARRDLNSQDAPTLKLKCQQNQSMLHEAIRSMKKISSMGLTKFNQACNWDVRNSTVIN
jgi:hypothetical protein